MRLLLCSSSSRGYLIMRVICSAHSSTLSEPKRSALTYADADHPILNQLRRVQGSEPNCDPPSWLTARIISECGLPNSIVSPMSSNQPASTTTMAGRPYGLWFRTTPIPTSRTSIVTIDEFLRLLCLAASAADSLGCRISWQQQRQAKYENSNRHRDLSQ